jgi:hypothetical protein
MRWFLLAWFTMALVAACSGGGDTSVTQGSEGAACYPNGTCNSGLACISNGCVKSVTDGGVNGGTDSSANPDAVADTSSDSADLDSGAIDSGAIVDVASDVRDDAGLLCPSAAIFHPGPETRNVNTSVPFIGRGRDPSCAALTGASLVWVDSLEGPIGTGETFNHTFTQTGTHTVTLTATDGQSRKYTASITFKII